MRFNQISETTKTTAQDVYAAAQQVVGAEKLKSSNYVISKKTMGDVKKLLPGVRVLPKEIRDSEVDGVYDFKLAGVTLVPAVAEITAAEAMKTVASGIKTMFKPRWGDIDEQDDEISIRHWGNWEVPEGEEDDGDYDWEVLSRESSKQADENIKKLSTLLPSGWELTMQVGEKNWLYFTVHKV